MQFSKFVAVATLAVFAACGGGDQAAETTADSTATVAAEAPAAPATATEVTGTTHVVQMLGDEKGYRFEPANITIKTGDAIRFEMVSGGPHNVAFDPATLSPEAKAALIAGLPNPMAELSTQMFLNPGESVTINFANVPAGVYDYICTPHLAMGMKGQITVQ
jgi:plastocyanin